MLHRLALSIGLDALYTFMVDSALVRFRNRCQMYDVLLERARACAMPVGRSVVDALQEARPGKRLRGQDQHLQFSGVPMKRRLADNAGSGHPHIVESKRDDSHSRQPASLGARLANQILGDVSTVSGSSARDDLSKTHKSSSIATAPAKKSSRGRGVLGMLAGHLRQARSDMKRDKAKLQAR